MTCKTSFFHTCCYGDPNHNSNKIVWNQLFDIISKTTKNEKGCLWDFNQVLTIIERKSVKIDAIKGNDILFEEFWSVL